jgi:hypothetical protein
MAEIGKEKNNGSGCLKWGAVVCLVLFLMLLGGGYYVYKNFKSIGGAFACNVAESALVGMGLSGEELESAMKPIREVVQKAMDGKVSQKQLEKIMKKLTDGYLPGVIGTRIFDLRYLTSSELPEEEKNEGRMTLSRFSRGLIEKKIDKTTTDEIMAIISDKTSDDKSNEIIKLKETVTVEELRRCLLKMKEAADMASVESGEFKVNIAAEIRKAIDEGMSGADGE